MTTGKDRVPILALAGPSGVGKSTVSRALARRPGWRRLEEAYDRLVPPPPLDIRTQPALREVEFELLEEEAARFGEAVRLSRAGTRVVADTSFLDPVAYTAGLLLDGGATPGTYRAVVERALGLCEHRRLGVPDLLAYLSVARSARRARAVADPIRHPPELQGRHERVGALELRVVRPVIAATLPRRVRRFGARDPPAEIASRLDRWANGAGALRDPFTAAIRSLHRLEGEPRIRRALGASRNLKRGTLSPRAPR